MHLKNKNITPISDSCIINSLSTTKFNTPGPIMIPANNAPTTCGNLILLDINPNNFVENKINDISNKK